MRSIIVFLQCLFIFQIANAQGIKFEEGNWKTVKAKAKAENKLVYIDIYTTWCGPCKYMALKYFPAKESGDFYNSNFINYKIDAEKGEGIAIAEEYKVDAYPTNLFIDAATGKIIYRVSGMPSELNGFIKNGETALLEKNDPMNLQDYQTKYRSGEYDVAFLLKYLEKNERLEKNNDSVIDTYITKVNEPTPGDSTLSVILRYQGGVENNGYKLLLANAERIDKINSKENLLEGYKRSYYYTSLKNSVEATDKQRLEGLLNRMNEFELEDPNGTAFYYRSDLFTKTKNNAALWEVQKEYANLLLNYTQKDYDEFFEKSKKGLISQIKWQAKQQNAKDEDMDAIVKKNLERPAIKYSTQRNHANKLNAIAWSIYEKNQKKISDLEKVKMATRWAQKAANLVEPLPDDWIMIADTYAHLLGIQGNKTEAISIQEQVVQKAKETKADGIDNYEAYLTELKK